MPRKSSNIAKLNDMVASMTGLVKEVQDEMTGYMEDAEKYRELKPMLNKITNRIGQDTTAPLISEETTGQQDTGTEQTGQESTGSNEKKPGRRKKTNDTITNADPPNG